MRFPIFRRIVLLLAITTTLFLLFFTFSANAMWDGIVSLCSSNFDRIVHPYIQTPVLVKFDVKNPHGERMEKWRLFARICGSGANLLNPAAASFSHYSKIASVRDAKDCPVIPAEVNAHTEWWWNDQTYFNTDLTSRFNVTFPAGKRPESAPTLLLFQPGYSGRDDDTEHIIRFADMFVVPADEADASEAGDGNAKPKKNKKKKRTKRRRGRPAPFTVTNIQRFVTLHTSSAEFRLRGHVDAFTGLVRDFLFLNSTHEMETRIEEAVRIYNSPVRSSERDEDVYRLHDSTFIKRSDKTRANAFIEVMRDVKDKTKEKHKNKGFDNGSSLSAAALRAHQALLGNAFLLYNQATKDTSDEALMAERLNQLVYFRRVPAF